MRYQWFAILLIFVVSIPLGHAVKTASIDNLGGVHEYVGNKINTGELETIQLVDVYWNKWSSPKYPYSEIAEKIRNIASAGTKIADKEGYGDVYEKMKNIIADGDYEDILINYYSWKAVVMILIEAPEGEFQEFNTAVNGIDVLRIPPGGNTAEYIIYGEHGTYILGVDDSMRSVGIVAVMSTDDIDGGKEEIISLVKAVIKGAPEENPEQTEMEEQAVSEVESLCELPYSGEGRKVHMVYAKYCSDSQELQEMWNRMEKIRDRAENNGIDVAQTGNGYGTSCTGYPAVKETIMNTLEKGEIRWVITSEDIAKKIMEKKQNISKNTGASHVVINDTYIAFARKDNNGVAIVSSDKDDIVNGVIEELAKFMNNCKEAEGETELESTPQGEGNNPLEEEMREYMGARTSENQSGEEIPDEENAVLIIPMEGWMKDLNFAVINGEDYPFDCSDEGICYVTIPKDVFNTLKEIIIVAKYGDKIGIMSFSDGEYALPDCYNECVTVRKSGYDLAKTVVSKVEKEIDEKKKEIIYAAKGYVPVTIDANIPKTAENAPEISGEVAFLDLDPVIRIHMSVANGSVAVTKIVTEKWAEVKDVALKFSACGAYVDNLRGYIADESKKLFFLEFRIIDGYDPVYIPNTKVYINGKEIDPQFDADTMTYSATTVVRGPSAKITISARLSGCGEITHVEEIPLRQGFLDLLLPILTVIALVAVMYALVKIVWR